MASLKDNLQRKAASETLHSVQIYRASAVLLVVLFHGSAFILSRYKVAPLENMFQTGFSGVFLFFVISGFIILTAHHRDLGRPDRLSYYLSRRLIRIYPFFWVVLIIWGGWRIFTGDIGMAELASNALVFKGAPQLIIPVSWTLRYEIVFYALFVAAILDKRLGWLVFLGWFGLQWGYAPPALRGLTDPMNLLFMMGLGAAIGCFRLQTCSDATRDRLGWLFLMLGLTGFVVTMMVYGQLEVDTNAWPGHPVAIFGFGISSALLLLASVSGAINRRMGQWRLIALIGNASYAIYLTHSPFGKLAWNLLRPIKPLWQEPPEPWVANLILVWVAVASVLAGILVHLKIEQPLLAALRGRLANPAARAE
jgi:peptidoglycan/LPS O-acetylase OafA/YrhL